MEQNKPWPKNKIKDWKKFWTSEMGQEAIGKMQAIKSLCLDYALQADTNEKIAGFVARAAGVDLVIGDIQQGILLAEQEDKPKEDKKQK